MKLKTIIFFLLTGLCAIAQVKPSTPLVNAGQPKAHKLLAAVKEHVLGFKGFDLKILGDAADTLGNHMMICNIIEIGTAPEKQDPFVTKVLNKSLDDTRDHKVILTTDKNYNPVEIFSPSSASVVKYDAKLQKFILGCDNFIGEMANGHLTTYYQPLLLVVDAEMQGQHYAIPSPHSCTLLDISVNGNLIDVFTKSIGKTETDNDRYRIEIMTVNTETVDAQNAEPSKILNPANTVRTVYDENVSLQLSKISRVDNVVYFATSSIDLAASAYINHVYKFENDKLEEQAFDKGNLIFTENWYNTNGFNVRTKNDFFLSISGRTGSDITLLKTDGNLNVGKKIEIPTLGFTDDDEAVELTSGAILLASIGSGKLWRYTVYDAELKFVKEIASQVPESYGLEELVDYKDGIVKAIFNNFDKSDKKSVIIQEIDVVK